MTQSTHFTDRDFPDRGEVKRRGEANRHRNRTLGVRISPEENAKLAAAAKGAGMSISAYVREAALTAAEYAEMFKRMDEAARATEQESVLVACQHPSCLQTFPDMEAMARHFDRAHEVRP